MNQDLIELTATVDTAFNKDNVDIVSIKNVILTIHATKKDKEIFKDLYDGIGKRLFQNQITLSEYQTDYFSSTSVDDIKEPKQYDAETIVEKFDDKLRKLLLACEADLKLLNKFILLKLGNDDAIRTSFLLLYDSHSKPYLFSRLQTVYENECTIYDINIFLDDLIASKIRTDENYIALLVLSFNPAPDDSIIKKLNQIKGYLNPLSQIIPVNNKSENQFYTIEEDFRLIEGEIKYLVSKELKDLDLDSEVEKIIKKLFRDNISTSLQYKKMSKGFSGSIVLYVRPVGFSHTQVRYVVKVGLTSTSKSKIQSEIENFNKYVDSYSTSYQIKVTETNQCVAIRYTYASKDGKIDAESFAELFDKTEDLRPIIGYLFESTLFKEWSHLRSVEKITFDKDYKSYVNLDEIIPVIATIQNKKIEEVLKSKLLRTFARICELELESYKNVCHGDLHSENFFIDKEQNVLLIDFGDTDIRHSVIDYATLECSIKFKHIPKYIENEELYAVEEELLLRETFSAGYSFKSITRPDLIKPYQTVIAIRSEAHAKSVIKNLDSDLEYLYSLFMITFRQIRYPTINQLYAIKSAELIGAQILNLVGQQLEHEAELKILQLTSKASDNTTQFPEIS